MNKPILVFSHYKFSKLFAVLKIILAIAATIIGFFIIMVVVGTLLKKKSVRTVRGILNFPPDEVWPAVLDVESNASYLKGLSKSEILESRADGSFTWREHYKGKNMAPITYDTVEMEWNEKIRWKIIDDGGLGFGGEWQVHLFPHQKGTEVVIRQMNEVKSPVLRFLSLFMNKSAKIRSYLKGLKKHLEKRGPSGMY